MESESRMPKDEAARALQAAEAVQARAAGVPRAHAVLMLVFAVMMSAYMALFVFAGSDAVDASFVGGYLDALMMPTMIIAALLLNGAGERYAGRLRASTRYKMALAVFGAMLVGILVWRIFVGGYPAWFTAVSVVVTLLVFGARPPSLLRHPAAVASPVDAAPLTTGARIATIVIGVLLGALCATAFLPAASVGLLVLAIILIGLASSPIPRWSLPATGWYWGLWQWVAFGVAAALMLLLALGTVMKAVTTPGAFVGVGVVVAASLVVAAFLPGRGEPDDDFVYDDPDEETADGAPEA